MGWPLKHSGRYPLRPGSSLHVWYSCSQSSSFYCIARMVSGNSRNGARPTIPCGLAITVFDSLKRRRQKTSKMYSIAQNCLGWTCPSGSSPRTLSGLAMEVKTMKKKMMTTTAVQKSRTTMTRWPPLLRDNWYVIDVILHTNTFISPICRCQQHMLDWAQKLIRKCHAIPM